MKKLLICIIMMFLAFSLCGCKEEEETKTLDYEQMDREFGQLKEEEKEETENSEEFAQDMPKIQECVEEYAYCLLYGDANRYARTFPNDYVIAIMDEEGCTWDTAVDISSNKIWETFNSIENKYLEVRELNQTHGHTATIKSVNKYSRGTTIMNVYNKIGINVNAVIEVKFVISSADKNAEAVMRFVRTEKGSWEPDMSYFGI